MKSAVPVFVAAMQFNPLRSKLQGLVMVGEVGRLHLLLQVDRTTRVMPDVVHASNPLARRGPSFQPH